MSNQIKLYLVYTDRATDDYLESGIIVGATSPEEAFAFWDDTSPGTVSVCELPQEHGVITKLLCEQGRELTWLRQDYLPGVTFEYTPKVKS